MFYQLLSTKWTFRTRIQTLVLKTFKNSTQFKCQNDVSLKSSEPCSSPFTFRHPCGKLLRLIEAVNFEAIVLESVPSSADNSDKQAWRERLNRTRKSFQRSQPTFFRSHVLDSLSEPCGRLWPLLLRHQPSFALFTANFLTQIETGVCARRPPDEL